MKFSIIDSPDKFLEAFPTDLKENIEKRQELHAYLAEDKEAQKVYMEMCLIQPQIAFDSAFWTYDPRQPVGYKHRPFILRPKQRVAVNKLKDAIDNQHNLIIDKSREEGATEIICKLFALYWLLSPESCFLVGSRKEDLVDSSVDYKDGKLIGAHQSLFHKILYGIVNAPVWLIPNFNKKHLFLQNLDNGATHIGESTNESFGAAGRATAALVDELARIEPDVAQFIIDTISDVSPCCIYNSTHFRWGSGHPYARLLRSNKIETVTLGFEENPEKNQGLYRSPVSGVVEIIDEIYYKENYPEIFQYAEN